MKVKTFEQKEYNFYIEKTVYRKPASSKFKKLKSLTHKIFIFALSYKHDKSIKTLIEILNFCLIN